MKKYVLPLVLLLIFAVPNLMFSWLSNQMKDTPSPVFTDELPTEAIESSQRTLLVKHGEDILTLDLESYVLGVLFGEMPAEFEPEALMAQAVATRTYTLRRVANQMKHEDANLCTEAQCCQAYMTIAEYVASGGDDVDVAKMQEAVNRTKGQVLTYDGKLIEATYFSCSGGKTEDAVDVWGQSVPYLKSVDSPGEESCRHYSREIVFMKQVFLAKMGLPSNMALNTHNILTTYTEGGGIDILQIGDHAFSGVQLRSLLSLPSTAVSLTFKEDSVVISVKGNGHRVGMSQYGADAMAVSGKTYTQILSHYYPGTKLEVFTADQLNAIFDKAGNL